MTSAAARRPRPVLCVTAHEHRSRAVADGVRAGRFTVAGETRTLGTDPDWRSASLPADEEWRIEWVKFGWGLDLAHAAAATGDPGYQRVWEDLTASWIWQVPADADAAEVTARRILNWIYAWQRLAPGEEHEALLLSSLEEQVAHVRAHLAPERNHRTLELYALFVAAIALPELDRDGLLDLAVAELDRNLATDFRPDGVHREASTHYHAIALRSFVGVSENARRHGIELPPGFDARLARACTFAAHCTRPDGTIPALSDADTGDYGRLLVQAADLLVDEELRFVGSRGRAGRPPAVLNASFPDGGYFVQRSGWSPRRAVPDLRLRTARRRRPRPLRPAQHRGARPRPAARRRPRARQLLRGAAEPAPLVQEHRRPQHRLRRRPRPDALQPRATARAGGARAPAGPRLRAGARRARR